MKKLLISLTLIAFSILYPLNIIAQTPPPTENNQQKSHTPPELKTLVENWLKARNDKDANALSLLFAKDAYTHAKSMTREEIKIYHEKAFKKHTDHTQSITADPIYDKIDNNTWSIRIPTTFTQSKKMTTTEVLLIAQNIDQKWLILIESDEAMDQKIMKKLKISMPKKTPKTCNELIYQILLSSPYLRSQIMQRWEIAKKNNIQFTFESTQTPPKYDFTLIENHIDEKRLLNTDTFTYNTETRTLYLYNPIQDTLEPTPYNRQLDQKLPELCKP